MIECKTFAAQAGNPQQAADIAARQAQHWLTEQGVQPPHLLEVRTNTDAVPTGRESTYTYTLTLVIARAGVRDVALGRVRRVSLIGDGETRVTPVGRARVG